MFNLKKWLGLSSKESEEPEEPEEIEPLMCFKLNLHKNGSLDIVCNWDHEYQTLILGEAFGQVLNNLTTGQYNKIIAEIFLESLNDDPNIDENFISSIIGFLRNNQGEQMKEFIKSQPLIHPLHTFGESNIGKQE